MKRYSVSKNEEGNVPLNHNLITSLLVSFPLDVHQLPPPINHPTRHTMTIPNLPLDIYHLLLPFLPTLDCHLALSNTSSLLQRSLYPSDSNWLRLLQEFGWPYGSVRGEKKETRTAKEVVLDIVCGRRCSVGRIKRGEDGGEKKGQCCKGRMLQSHKGFAPGSVVSSFSGVCEEARKWIGQSIL